MSDQLARIDAPLAPGSTIGIIGGGQLGRMLAASAARLGFATLILEPQQDCPAAQTANRQIVAAYDDSAALDEMARLCDVVTYEFENVPDASAVALQSIVPLSPPQIALTTSQDRLLEKQFLQASDIPVAPFKTVDTGAQLSAALNAFGGGVLKTRRFGYDGKGQRVFKSAECDDPDAVLAETGAGPYVLEQLVDFKSEFSIVAARSWHGEVACFEPARNEHEDGILRRSTVPSGLAAQALSEAMDIAGKLLNGLDYVGVIGIEFFETADGILVNEFAPRVHNSGHWTDTACQTSQFEQHIRAICGLPLGSADRHSDCVMENLLGDEASDIAALMHDARVSVTLYGKAQSRKGRKMGHLNRLLPLTGV